MKRVVVVFAKTPRSGEVKTRMSPALNLDQAADLYACMLEDVLEHTAAMAASFAFEPVLAVHPAVDAPYLARRAPPAFRVVPQRGPHLGARMANAVLEAGAGGVHEIVLRGSDSPVLDAPTFRAAFDALGDNDLAICPDRDGGYNLVALRGLHAAHAFAIFGHPMSHASVLDQTQSNAENLGLRVELLEPGFDLDTASDLAHLAAVRLENRALPCPRTLTYLDDNLLWPPPPSTT